MNSQRWRWCCRSVCFFRHSECVHVRVHAVRHKIPIAGHAPRDTEAASLYIAINRRHQRRARAHVSLRKENKEQLSAVAEQQVRRAGAVWGGGGSAMHAAAGQVRMSTCGSKRCTTNDKLRCSNKAITSSNKAVIVFHYGATTPICIIFCSLARRAAPAR